MRITRRMQTLFKFGLTVVVMAAVAMFYFSHNLGDGKDAVKASDGGQEKRAAPQAKKVNVVQEEAKPIADPHEEINMKQEEEERLVQERIRQEAEAEIRREQEAADAEAGEEEEGNVQQAGEEIKLNGGERQETEEEKGRPGQAREKVAERKVQGEDAPEERAVPGERVSEQREEPEREEPADQSHLGDSENKAAAVDKDEPEKKSDFIHLGLVACGDHLETAMMVIKSAAILTRSHVHVHIFAELELQPQFDSQLKTWPEFVRERLTWKIYDLSFPAGTEYKADEWKKLFKPCASQRLFFPDLLKDVDSMLYVDTDILFMRPLDDIWAFFKQFNSTQIAALAPEHESPNAGWYNRFARHPYYGPLGVNSGVMLMNLTRMREARFLSHIVPYYKEYKLRITWGDQDLINIFFHYFPQMLYVYDCDWNYRPDHCMYMSVCKQAEQRGVSVVHGCRSVYHNDKQPAFKAIYNTVKEYRFGDDLQTTLVEIMDQKLQETNQTPCGRVGHVFTYQLKRQAEKLRQDSRR